MYRYEDAQKYVNKVFKDYSVEQILLYMYNDYWELSHDKVHAQRLNHKALVEMALDKI